MLHSRARSSGSGPAKISLPSPGWRDSFRWPELAASAPSRPAVHRALRLLIATGTAAAGVCLVLAMTVLVVRLGAAGLAPTAPSSPIAASQSGDSDASRGGRSPTASSGTARLWMAGPAIASFRGTGPVRHAHFAVRSPGTWGLSWAFNCPARRPGNLRLIAKGTASGDDVELDVAGPTGRGITWNSRDAGDHFLDVNSDCSWTARVVLPKSPDHQPTSG